ncbi:MAG: hypothetical protein WCY25_03895 [Moheibacter sp.]
MKKLGLLIIGSFLLAACDATPKGNKSIMPVEHEEAMEHVDHNEHHEIEAQNDHGQATTATDSTQNTAAEVPASEPVKTDSAQ